jgi:Reverse transcriptase (RNA-dependent DNA polymerase)/Endonuclease-reverse transcriptase
MDTIDNVPFANISNAELVQLFSPTLLPALDLNSLFDLSDSFPSELCPDFRENSQILKSFNLDLNNCSYASIEDCMYWPKFDNPMTIIHINCRSLNKNFDSIHSFIMSLSLLPSVILLTETWLSSESPLHFYHLENYSLLSKPRESNKSGGGVAMYISNMLTYREINSTTQGNFGSFEYFAVDILLKQGVPLKIMVVYRPPDASLTIFIEELSNLLEVLNQKNNQLLIAGDFNIDLLKTGTRPTNDSHLQFCNLLISYGFYPTITIPTRITLSSATLIDNIFINKCFVNQFSRVIYEDISDHLPILLQLNLEHNSHYDTTATKILPKRIYSHRNIQKFVELANNVKWTNLFDSDEINKLDDVNKSYNIFASKFQEIFNMAFPLTLPVNQSRKNQHKLNTPWFTAELKDACKKKRLLFKRKIKNPTPTNAKIYNTFRNNLKTLIRKQQRIYYLREFQKYSQNTTKTWKLINLLVKHKNVRDELSTIPTEFCIDGKTSNCSQKIANALNDFFISIGQYKKPSQTDNGSTYTSYLKTPNPISCFLSPTDTYEINSVLNSMEGKTSAGVDETNLLAIKLIGELIAPSLASLINLSMETGKFPDQLKIAKIIPLHKTGPKGDISNYRPISLLNSFSKIFEKIILKRMESFISKCNILVDQQYGFRAKHSTEQALMELINKITDHIDNKKYVVCIAVDIQKAFDSLHHKTLLGKLEYYGFRGKILSLLQNFLSNRYQYVTYNNCSSTPQLITTGIPQGSVLGPLLFLLYINDLKAALKQDSPILFADDSSLIYADISLKALAETVNSELLSLTYWMDANKLSLNVKKTNYLLFQNHLENPTNLPIQLYKENIQQVLNMKILGVYIDNKLNWKPHLNQLDRKLSSTLFVLRKIRNQLNTKIALSIYNALIYSSLQYGILLWGRTYPTSLKHIQVLQNKCLKCCLGLPSRTSTHLIYNKAKTLTVDKIYIYKAATLIYNVLNQHLPIPPNITKMFTLAADVHQHATRNSSSSQLFQSSFSSSIKGQTIKIQAPIVWNSIPLQIKLSQSVKVFKSSLKSVLVDQ